MIGYLGPAAEPESMSKTIVSGGVETTIQEIHDAFLETGMRHTTFNASDLESFLLRYMHVSRSLESAAQDQGANPRVLEDSPEQFLPG